MGDEHGFRASFDHVALALHRMTDAWPTLVGALGGRYRSRGLVDGYSWLQIAFADGFAVETLHPEAPLAEPAEMPDRTGSTAGFTPGSGAPYRRGEFVRRFLTRRGPGPHHLTFLVDDLDAAMGALATAGVRLGVVDRTQPAWQEALYSAEVAHGVVLQVVQREAPFAANPEPPEGFPELGYDHPVASLGRVVHAVADLDAALRLYGDALGGRVTSSGAAVDGNHWVELGWDGPGRLRLLEAAHAEIAEFVGDRPGRVRHLYFTFDDPSSVPGARQLAEGRWVVDADDELGVRLVVSSTVR